jgi:hypothetical protein
MSSYYNPHISINIVYGRVEIAKYRAFTTRGNLVTPQVGRLLIRPYPSYLPLVLVKSAGEEVHENCVQNHTEIPALILWLETTCSSSIRNRKLK